MNPSQQLAHQVKETWEKSLGPERTFVIGKEHACPVTINGITRKFAIRKDSGAGKIKLRMLVSTGYGPTFVHFALNGEDLTRLGSKPASENHIAEFEALFSQPGATLLTERDEIVAEIQRQLQPHGWSPMGLGSLASKLFETAVGPKEAQLYLSDWGHDSPVYVINGIYQSEGRNALSTTSAHIPKSVTKEELLALINNLAPEVDQVVSQTYAARLLKSEPGRNGLKMR